MNTLHDAGGFEPHVREKVRNEAIAATAPLLEEINVLVLKHVESIGLAFLDVFEDLREERRRMEARIAELEAGNA